jgi:glucose/arabinose dehydrogenase
MFVDYTRREGKRGKIESVISEFHADPNADSIDPTTEQIVFTLDQPQENHNGGQLQFGPDGMLYIGFGDGGGGNDVGGGHDKYGNGQSHRTLLGKILRVDVNGEVGKYTVPKDNPFVKDPSYKPEIWALGLRNPWRFSFDRKTGTMYGGDVGQGIWEEIDVIEKGGNYGWRIREGLHPFNERDPRPPEPLIDPLVDYHHGDAGLSVTGGYVYRGKAFPEWDGIYFYGDYSSARIWALKYDEKAKKMLWNKELPVTVGKRTGPNQLGISSFGEDADGEIYVCDHGGGKLYQMTPTK